MGDYSGLRILVLDGYGRQMPSILRQLHALGCEISTVNDSKLNIGYTSRYPKHKFVIKGVREDPKLMKDFLEKAMSERRYDVIFPILEKSTDYLLTLEEAGKTNGTKIICAPRDAFMKAYDKRETMRVCQENGIPCPITKMDDESLDEYLDKVRFPLACKPRKGSGSAGFKVAESREHLLKLIEKGLSVEDYVIQEYIPHTDYHYGVYLMFDKNHKATYAVLVQSCRQYPVDGGPGCYIRTINNEEIRRNAILLLEKLNWASFGHVGLIMDPRDNVAKVMEVNGRIAAGVGICEHVGIPTVKYLLDLVFDKPLPLLLDKQIPEGIGMRHFQADFMWLLKSPERFKAKPSWFNFKNSYDYVWSWKDPIPFVSYTIEHIMTYRKDMEKRKR